MSATRRTQEAVDPWSSGLKETSLRKEKTTGFGAKGQKKHAMSGVFAKELKGMILSERF